ncbi:MAG TPA: sugar phosphate nucleotidyltransferase [Candidatus Acidoferrum sp.]|nr:sugar phosphate nucleotidyltransferase [Candidatus Acidoferrum sp.]
MPSERLPIHAVILAGGRGTRFWPRSRTKTPKQLLNIFGKKTMIEQTVARLRPLISPGHLWSVTNTEQSSALREQLPAAARKHVLTEPIGRNTAAAIALAAFHIRRASKGDALMAVLPADHYIAQAEKYRQIVAAALDVARTPGHMVVLGIPPTHPETGFGYIEQMGDAFDSRGFPVYAVRRFAEKPSLEVAKLYVSYGNFRWNAGMFFWRVQTFLENLKRHLPVTYGELEKVAAFIGTQHYGKKLRSVYPRLENISVDYAILERATQHEGAPEVYVIPAEIGWSDIGSWGAVYDLNVHAGSADPGTGNVFLSPGYVLDSQGNLISCPGKFTALIGTNNLVVVETPDALLICPRDRTQDVAKLVKWLEERKRKDLL